MRSRGDQRDLVSRCWERAIEHCKILIGVEVTGVPGIKPTDGMTAWKRDGKDAGNQCSPAFWSPLAAAPQGKD